MRDVDVVVIGLGPGGEAAAGELAEAGLDVIGVEARLVGGECPYYACVPTKMMIRAAHTLAEAGRVAELAGAADVRPDWAPVAARIRDEATDDWDDTVAVRRLEDKGATVVHGRGRITAPGEVTVTTDDGEETYRAGRAIVLNPGTEPAVPPVDGLADTPYWTNRDAVRATAVPESLVVFGGGPVGCEFSQVFARFGVSVTVIQSAPRLLPNDEPESGDLLAEVFRREGITVKLGTSASRVSHDGTVFTVELGGETVTAQQLLVAAGRTTDLAALGVKAVGLDDGARGITVDNRMRAADGVWAIGDVTGHGAFTHTSMYQARIAAADILGRADAEVADYRALPWVTFTDPEIGAVGLTEKAARDAGRSVRVGTARIAESSRGFIHKTGNDGFIKLIEDADRGVLLGATSVGPTGGEVLAALAVALQGEVPTATLRRMIYAYPTFHRAIENALTDLH